MSETSVLDTTQYLTFKLEREVFALEISKVREVLDYTSITKVPQTPDFMLGVINLRGRRGPGGRHEAQVRDEPHRGDGEHVHRDRRNRSGRGENHPGSPCRLRAGSDRPRSRPNRASPENRYSSQDQVHQGNGASGIPRSSSSWRSTRSFPSMSWPSPRRWEIRRRKWHDGANRARSGLI